MTTDALDRLWVERLVPGTVTFTTQSATGERRFDIYTPQGRLLAEASVPPRMSTPRSGRPVAITTDHVYTIATDGDDVPYFVSYRIVRN
jgi:hypothetical protein